MRSTQSRASDQDCGVGVHGVRLAECRAQVGGTDSKPGQGVASWLSTPARASTYRTALYMRMLSRFFQPDSTLDQGWWCRPSGAPRPDGARLWQTRPRSDNLPARPSFPGWKRASHDEAA